MTPTSALGGLLTGVVAGAVIAVMVLLALYVTGKFRRPAPIARPVAEDLPRSRPQA